MRRTIILSLLAIALTATAVAATPSGKKGAATTRKTTTTTVEKIPVLVNPIGGDFFSVSAGTMPVNGDVYNYLDRTGTFDSFYIIDETGKKISSKINGNAGQYDPKGYLVVSAENGDYVINLDGSVAIPAVPNKSISLIGEGVYCVYSFDPMESYLIDIQGHPLSVKFTDIIPETYVDGMLIYSQQGKYGILSTDGNNVAPIYDDMGTPSEGYVAVLKNEKIGVIDMKGNVVVPFVYDYEDVWGDDDGDPIPMTVHQGVVNVYKDSRWGVVDVKGNVVVPFAYDWISIDKNGDIYATNYGDITTTTVFNSKGNQMWKGNCSVYNRGELDLLLPYTDSTSYKEGFVNRAGQVVIPATYERVMPFIGSVAMVKKGGAWHLIDQTGKIVKKNVGKATMSDVVG